MSAVLAALLALAAATEVPALAGMDPVSVVVGEPLRGSTDLALEHQGLEYWFANTANQATFAESPSRYAIQNAYCPVMPRVPVDARVYRLHDGRIYAFGSEHCRDAFADEPGKFLQLLAHADADRRDLRFKPIEFRSQGLRFFGQIVEPEVEVSYATVLIHGSGDADHRQGWAVEIAEGLANQGVAVLVPDKRGSGDSEGSWRTATPRDLAEDAIAARTYLRQLKPRAKIGYVGISEGGSIAPLAGSLDDPAFVVAMSSSAVPLFEVAYHQYLNAVAREGFDSDDQNTALALHRALERHVAVGSGATWAAYHSLMQHALTSPPLRRFVQGLPTEADHWRWAWWRDASALDPIDSWRASDAPGLAVFGRLDDLSNVPVATSVRRLEALDDPVATLILDNVGHSLRGASHTVDVAVFERIAEWITATTATASPQ